MVGLTRHVRALGRTHGKCCWCAAALATFKWDQWIPRYLTNILKRTVSANVCALTVDRLLTRCRDNLRRTWYHYCRRWQYMPGFTAHNYCRGDIHIKSRHCPPKSDHPRIKYTRHTHDPHLRHSIPSWQNIDRRFSSLGPSQSGTAFRKSDHSTHSFVTKVFSLLDL